MNLKFAGAALLVGLGMGIAASASAGTYSFALSGSGYIGSGTLTTDDTPLPAEYTCPTCATGPAYRITSAVGTLNGNSISLLPLLDFAGNNNLIYPSVSGPYLDWGDFGFLSNGVKYDAFLGDYASHPGYFLISDLGGTYSNPITFTLGAPGGVPEPSSWALMIGGFGLAGAVLRRHRAVVAA